jgi:hypothetical protein
LRKIVVIIPILDHKDAHNVRPNRVAFKYPNFKKDFDSYAHVTVFNSIVKANAENSKNYIINVFNYTLRDITLYWCHNYILEFPNYYFLELTQAFCKHH